MLGSKIEYLLLHIFDFSAAVDYLRIFIRKFLHQIREIAFQIHQSVFEDRQVRLALMAEKLAI